MSLPQFEGPFDLLLALIARRRLDVTELALAEVTDEFLATMRASWELDHASEFLVVASTLLALKAHRLLPQDEAEQDEDDELIEARDLLFARLLQYRAFKEAAAFLGQRADRTMLSVDRQVGLPEPLAALLPPLVAHVSASELARLAAVALSRPDHVEVQTVHLHEPVAVSEQLSLLAWRLRGQGSATFTELTADLAEVGDAELVRALLVARFLALLVLHREGAVDLSQSQAMGEIEVHWIAQSGDTASLTGVLAGHGPRAVEEEFA